MLKNNNTLTIFNFLLLIINSISERPIFSRDRFPSARRLLIQLVASSWVARLPNQFCAIPSLQHPASYLWKWLRSSLVLWKECCISLLSPSPVRRSPTSKIKMTFYSVSSKHWTLANSALWSGPSSLSCHLHMSPAWISCDSI